MKTKLILDLISLRRNIKNQKDKDVITNTIDYLKDLKEDKSTTDTQPVFHNEFSYVMDTLTELNIRPKDR